SRPEPGVRVSVSDSQKATTVGPRITGADARGRSGSESTPARRAVGPERQATRDNRARTRGRTGPREGLGNPATGERLKDGVSIPAREGGTGGGSSGFGEEAPRAGGRRVCSERLDSKYMLALLSGPLYSVPPCKTSANAFSRPLPASTPR